MVPFAEGQGIDVEALVERLEYRNHYDVKYEPEFFPTNCICGELLTAQAYQFDDPRSVAYSTYTIGSVCAGNLEREMKRLNCVAKLGKYLIRPKSKLRETLLNWDLHKKMKECDLYNAKVISSIMWDRIGGLVEKLRLPYEKDTAFAEGICVVYGKVPKGAMLTYFLPDGSLW
jgi:hypothetical protein